MCSKLTLIFFYEQLHIRNSLKAFFLLFFFLFFITHHFLLHSRPRFLNTFIKLFLLNCFFFSTVGGRKVSCRVDSFSFSLQMYKLGQHALSWLNSVGLWMTPIQECVIEMNYLFLSSILQEHIVTLRSGPTWGHRWQRGDVMIKDRGDLQQKCGLMESKWN